MKTFVCRSTFSTSVENLFSFHEKVGFEALVGGSPGVEIIQKPLNLEPGSIAILKIPLFPGIKTRWKALHTLYEKNKIFQDKQEEGPFRLFLHSHIFKNLGDGKSELEDRIEFEAFLPFLSDHIVPIMLKKQFIDRHKITAKHMGVDFKISFVGPER